jgi:hypothetical protein
VNTARSFAVIALVGFVALSRTQVSFGQDVPVPAAPALAPDPQPAPGAAAQAAPALPPAAGAQPASADGVQPLPPAQPDPPAAAQPLPAAPAQPAPAAAVPPGAAPPVGGQAVPVAGVPGLSLIRTNIIGARAILIGGVRIGTVQDLLLVAGSGEYVLVANPSGFVSIPQSLTVFDPVSRILQVNMTFAQVAELPRLLRLTRLNRQFLERLHGFFSSPRGETILRNGIARNGGPTRSAGGPERRGETRPPGGPDRRAETRTAGKPVGRQQNRPEQRPENGAEARR